MLKPFGSFTDFEENEMASDFYTRIDPKQLVTHIYLQISILTKYLVIQSINNHDQPFDDMGNFIIDHFEVKTQNFFEIVKKELQVLINEVNIKQFKAAFLDADDFYADID